MKAMKRYIVFLPVFVWAIFFAGAEVKVENASIHRSGDSIRVSFKILVPSGTIASDYVERRGFFGSRRNRNYRQA